ncbi:MAG: hypothetical protein HND53_05235 [Proteobacteria bacterium]|nr:hypothetical protein [Pseudomonadota bacterium]NOG59885.1 hypothetical protein [Pseudomonadota bacterium]
MTLSQTLLHQQTVFAIMLYCISVIVAIMIFAFIQQKINNPFSRYCWDKMALPFIKTLLIIGFILLVYPINYGIDSAPSITELLNTDSTRSNFLLNIIFLVTFFYPLIPVIGKWEELIVPLQGFFASMIIFIWLCSGTGVENYSLFPDFKTITIILLISFITHWLAKYVAAHIGEYLDRLYNREGFDILIFKAVVLVMQSPVIFIYGLYLGKQIN